MAIVSPSHFRRRRPSRLGRMARDLVQRLPQTRPTLFRLLLVWGVLVGSGLLLALNLFRLQVVDAPRLLKQAREQQMIYMRPFVPRRPILDRDRNLLAVDRPVYTLYAHPKLFKQPKQAIAAKVAPILGWTEAKLLKIFDRGESGLRVEYSLTEDKANRITALQQDGLELLQYQQRLYPQQNLTADVVGYVDADHRGQAGVEYSVQDSLERSVKAVRLNRSGTGALMPDRVPGGFLHVDDLQLQLTIDSRLQRVALEALQQQIKRYNAKRGVVLAMDVRNGDLRVLVGDPSYNPNQYYNSQVELFKTWAITDLYEPGSTFKPINVAIALEAGAITPETTVYDEGQIYVGGWPIQNFDYSSRGGRGTLTLTEVTQYSSNVGMVRIVQHMKPGLYYDWLEKLGLGKKTGIDLPFEALTQLKTRKTFLESPVESATAAFGQGFALTPIQLLQLHAALANGGKLVTPHVVQGLYHADGSAYWQPDRPLPKTVFSPSTTRAVMAMMEAVVSKGTGKSAQISGYRVAGKTGTAQKAGPGGGYTSGKITSFIGLFPVDAPRFAVLAVIDEPKGEDAFGSTVAAPIVKSVMEALITIEKIPPSRAAAASPTPTP